MMTQTMWQTEGKPAFVARNKINVTFHLMKSFEIALQEQMEDISKYEVMVQSIGNAFFDRMLDSYDSIEDAIQQVNTEGKLTQVQNGLHTSIQSWLDHSVVQGSAVSVTMNPDFTTVIGLYSPRWEMMAREEDKLTIH